MDSPLVLLSSLPSYFPSALFLELSLLSFPTLPTHPPLFFFSRSHSSFHTRLTSSPLPLNKMDAMQVISLNAKGFNIPEERHMMLHDLKRLRMDVEFLQETHFRSDKLPFLKNRFYPTTYHSTNKGAKSKELHFCLTGSHWTLNGQLLFLCGLIGDIQVTLATLYAPNNRQDLFIRDTLEKLTFTTGQLILGADFKVPLIPSLDTSSGVSSFSPASQHRVTQALQKAQLVDVWRLQHSGARDYTLWRGRKKKKKSIYSCRFLSDPPLSTTRCKRYLYR